MQKKNQIQELTRPGKPIKRSRHADPKPIQSVQHKQHPQNPCKTIRIQVRNHSERERGTHGFLGTRIERTSKKSPANESRSEREDWGFGRRKGFERRIADSKAKISAKYFSLFACKREKREKRGDKVSNELEPEKADAGGATNGLRHVAWEFQFRDGFVDAPAGPPRPPVRSSGARRSGSVSGLRNKVLFLIN